MFNLAADFVPDLMVCPAYRGGREVYPCDSLHHDPAAFFICRWEYFFKEQTSILGERPQ